MSTEKMRLWGEQIPMTPSRLLGNNQDFIVGLLRSSKPLTVTAIAEDLDVSHKAVSKHLIMLHNLDVLHSSGHSGHVFYSLNPEMPRDFKKILDLL